ncbi:MAG: relaxase/mobilization nuclease domain-containing protein [Synergistaceae bacterium]|jgi:hypothetical protein|nr:relaxase/mobilization nuclease domain-containing protein [Synergistaceae bacterium]
MIGKHITNPKTRSSFSALNAYITGKSKGQPPGEKIAHTGCLNLASVETATLEMESLAFLNKRCKDPVMHLLLSWRENETPTPEQALEAVETTLDELNLSQCQAVYSLHQNTDNMHLHICVSRIDPETHRAITPAGGWTRRGMERVARRIERAQGWASAENAWSEFNENGELIRKPVDSYTAKIPQKVKDAENLTGEQSAVRKAQEALAGNINGIRDWDSLHNLMVSNGMRYEKKGSGAVIHIGDIIVKANSVSRSLSLKSLEKTLGEYRPVTDYGQAGAPVLAESANIAKPEKISEPKPLDKTNDNPGWRAYIAERKIYYRDKKQIRERLRMSQREERGAMRKRQAGERADLFASLKGKGFNRAYIAKQRSILASKHAYESVVLKESQASARKAFQNRHDIYSSYERWLRERGHVDGAEAWRHRRDSAFLQLQSPNSDSLRAGAIEPNTPKGLAGFSVAVTKQGLRYYRESAPREASFIDTGRLIRVYKQDDDTLLAALRLAQEKWGGVHINGTDDYKRKCAEIAAKNGIRVSNPELSGIVKEFERASQPPMSVDAARKTIEAETTSQESKHRKAWDSYNAHKKEFEALAAGEPKKPKLFGIGVKKWRADHAAWESERGKLLEMIRSDLESLGVRRAHDGVEMDKAHREAATRHDRLKEYAAEEALRLHPDAAAIVREDDARIEREERAQREAEEMKARIREENYSCFRASIRELAAKFGEEVFIVTNAQDGRSYSGLVLGTAERDGSHYAAQMIGDSHVILHHVEKDDLPQVAAIVGKNVEIKCLDRRIGTIVEEREWRERSRGWSR